MPSTLTIKLGDEVKDRVTGIRGITTAKLEFLNGCVQFCVQPKAKKDGAYEDARYFDVQQLEYIGQGVNVEQRKTGGPTPAGTPTRYGA